ncbi:septum formation initiator family protein [Sutterella sp.]|uniref:septum formation initiator family protein n=1 Tax=Sutterella sp. TaxID=1981025 RepID=UPI0026E075A6|nr:septum formation initiator family protein [Sutterella sp.]MDO5531341.1 septum formation initiator family protein [Sutterella sp.]
MVRFFLFVLFLGCCFAQYQLWAGRASWDRVRELENAVRMQRADNEELRRGNEALAAEYASLASNQDAIEEIARYELNMIKPDEVLFRIETAEEAARKQGAVEAMPNVDAPEIRAGAKPTFAPRRSDLYHAPKDQRAPKARDRRE